MKVPALIIVFPFECDAHAHLDVCSWEDERRVLLDLHRRDVLGDALDAITHLLDVLGLGGEDAT